MSHTELRLIRHGEVARDWQGRIYGDLDVPLSPRGQEQSRAVAEALSDVDLAAVVSSGLERAAYAARIVAGSRGLEVGTDPRLKEIYRGDWAGLTFEEASLRDPEAFRAWRDSGGAIGAPGGESLAEVSTRVRASLDELASELRGTPSRSAVIVAHKWVLAVAAAAAMGLPLDACGELKLEYSTVVHLRWPVREPAEGPVGGLDGGAVPELVSLSEPPI